MKKITIALVAIFSVAVITVSCKEGTKKDNVKKEVKAEKQEVHNHDMATAAYQCPMDCEHGKTYAKEGNCPVCNMKLKKVAPKNTDSNNATDSTKVSCKMNYKNCTKGCKGKTDCKGKTNCKGKMDCKTKSACKGNANSNNKACPKSYKGNCKKKA